MNVFVEQKQRRSIFNDCALPVIKKWSSKIDCKKLNNLINYNNLINLFGQNNIFENKFTDDMGMVRIVRLVQLNVSLPVNLITRYEDILL